MSRVAGVCGSADWAEEATLTMAVTRGLRPIGSPRLEGRSIKGMLIAFGCLLAFPGITQAVVPEVPSELLPSLATSAMWAGPVIAWGLLRNPLNKFATGTWIAWFVIGHVNLVASYIAFGDFYLLDADLAARIYIAFTFAYCLGVLLAEQWQRPDSTGAFTSQTDTLIRDRPSLAYVVFLLAFPLVYIGAMYTTLGYLPLIRGGDFTAEIYNTYYGPLYAYGFTLVFSMLYVFYSLFDKRPTWRRTLLGIVLLAIVGIAVSDGKRYFAVLFILACVPFLFRVRPAEMRHLHPMALIAGLVGLGGLVYVGVLAVRTGSQPGVFAVLELQLAAVGVEYRDFVYSVNHFEAGLIPGYDWLRSTVFSLLNSTLLAGVGIDKHAETLRGSAYVWRELVEGEFGVRTGIASELFFCYGYGGLAAMLAVGVGVGWLGMRLLTVRRRATLSFPSAVYALVILLPVSQSTATAGLLSLVGYVYATYWVLDRVEPRCRTREREGRSR